MVRNRLLSELAAAAARVLPDLYTRQELQDAADRVRDRDDCRGRSTGYACGLEDGAVSVIVEAGACNFYDGRTDRDWPEAGWATDQTGGSR